MRLAPEQNKHTRYAILLLHAGSPADTSWIETWRFLRRKLSDRRLIDPIPRWLWAPFLHLFVLPWRISRVQEAQKAIWVVDQNDPFLDYCGGGDGSENSACHPPTRRNEGKGNASACHTYPPPVCPSFSSSTCSSRKCSGSPPPVPSTPPLSAGTVNSNVPFSSLAPLPRSAVSSSPIISPTAQTPLDFSRPSTPSLSSCTVSVPGEDARAFSLSTSAPKSEEETKKKRKEKEGEERSDSEAVSGNSEALPNSSPSQHPSRSLSRITAEVSREGAEEEMVVRQTSSTATRTGKNGPISTCTSVEVGRPFSGSSPSVHYTTRLCALLRQYFQHPQWVARHPREAVQVECGFAYQSNSVQNALDRLQLLGDYTDAVDTDGHRARVKEEHLLLLPLFPQYSSVITASLFDTVMQSSFFKPSIRKVPTLHFRSSYCAHPRYIQCLEQHIRKYFSMYGPPFWLFVVFPSALKSFMMKEDDDVYLKECCRTFAYLRQDLSKHARLPVLLSSRQHPPLSSFPLPPPSTNSSVGSHVYAPDGRRSPVTSLQSSTTSNLYFPRTSPRECALPFSQTPPPPVSERRGGGGTGSTIGTTPIGSTFPSSQLPSREVGLGNPHSAPMGYISAGPNTEHSGVLLARGESQRMSGGKPGSSLHTTSTSIGTATTTSTNITTPIHAGSTTASRPYPTPSTMPLSSSTVSSARPPGIPPLNFPPSSQLPSPRPPSVNMSDVAWLEKNAFHGPSTSPREESTCSLERGGTPRIPFSKGEPHVISVGSGSSARNGNSARGSLPPLYDFPFPPERIKLLFLPSTSPMNNRSIQEEERTEEDDRRAKEYAEEQGISLSTSWSTASRSPSAVTVPPASPPLPLHLRYHPDKVFSEAYAAEKLLQGQRTSGEERGVGGVLPSSAAVSVSPDSPSSSVHGGLPSCSLTSSPPPSAASSHSSIQHKVYIFCPGNVVEDESTMLAVRNHLIPACRRYWDNVQYIPALNDSLAHVNLLADLLTEYMIK